MTQVFGLADLSQHIAAAVQGRQAQVFDLVPAELSGNAGILGSALRARQVASA